MAEDIMSVRHISHGCHQNRIPFSEKGELYVCNIHVIGGKTARGDRVKKGCLGVLETTSNTNKTTSKRFGTTLLLLCGFSVTYFHT